jgi:hypothetical protein
MIIENKKPIITFVVGLLLGALLWAVIAPAKTATPLSPAEAIAQAKLANQKQNPLVRYGNAQIHLVAMPWAAATKMLENAPIQKIELLTGLSIKLYLVGGPVFVTEQPSKDAYVPLISKSKTKIQIIK